MDRFDTRSIGAVAGITLISAILTFKFEWYFITHEFGWHSVLLWIPYLILEFWVSTVAFILLSTASRRWLIDPLIRFLGK